MTLHWRAKSPNHSPSPDWYWEVGITPGFQTSTKWVVSWAFIDFLGYISENPTSEALNLREHNGSKSDRGFFGPSALWVVTIRAASMAGIWRTLRLCTSCRLW